MAPTLLSNSIRGISLRINKIFQNPYKKVGLSSIDIKLIKNKPDNNLHTYKFLGRNIFFCNSYEFLYGTKEIFIDEIYKIDLPQDAFIIDCGANIGLSVLYFKKLFPQATVVAFEPDEKNFDLLTKNTASFSLEKVILRKEAVWVDNTEIYFRSAGNMGSKIESLDVTKDLTKIHAIRLKDLLSAKINMLKLDIEGAEYKVLKDISDRLDMVDNMFIEYHGKFEQNNELNEILNILSGSGFKYYIKEASSVYTNPFYREENNMPYDIQLNIFCFKK